MIASRGSTETTVDERPHPSSSQGLERILTALVALGIALRLWQYLADLSMWFDELSIARNITERSFAQLLGQPLAFTQTAPLGFLAALDVAVILVLTLVALDLCTREPTVRSCVVAGIAGLVSAFFSQIAVMVLTGLGAGRVMTWKLP